MQHPVWSVGKRGYLCIKDERAEGSERLRSHSQQGGAETALNWALRIWVGGSRILGVKTEFLGRACPRRAGVAMGAVHGTQVNTDAAHRCHEGTFRCSVELSWASSCSSPIGCVSWG